MAVRPIVTWPDPRLATVCTAVGAPGPAHLALIDDLLDTMYAAAGRGLAAPQIGETLRVFVLDATWKDGHPTPLVVIDPTVLRVSAELLDMDEGCLSIPGITTLITRPATLRAAWTDLDGTRVEAELTGVEARIFQHEADHLDGRVTFDRLAPEARAAALADYAR